jgi:transposase
MSKKSSYLSDELSKTAKEELKRLGKNVLVARKLEAIISACEHGITEVAKIYNVTHKTLTFWIKNFLSSKLEKLKSPPNRRRKTILNDSDREALKEIIDENSQVTINFLVQKAEEICGKKISKSSMHREIQKMRYSYITPRPQHYKQDKDKVEAFKKISTMS